MLPIGMYRILALGNQIGIGVAGSVEAHLFSVAKCNSPSAPYCIPNELICAEFGRILRLPVPPSGIVHSPGASPTEWFASLNFNLTGNSLPPVDTRACTDQLADLSTGLVVFDAFIANSDRHRNNFAVDFGTRPPRMSIFDHSHALFGNVAGQGLARLAAMTGRFGLTGGPHTGGNRQCLLDHLKTADHLNKWVSRVEAIPDFFIEEVCGEAVGLGITDAEAIAATDFLKDRRNNLRRILAQNQKEFRGITNWSLLV